MMNLIILIILFFIIGMIFLFLNVLISKKYFNLRVKNSSFECGFDSMMSSRLPFSVNFYLIGILFLIFDVEVVLMLPLIISLNLLVFNKWIYSSLMIMLILYLGLEYEKIQGSLKWFF